MNGTLRKRFKEQELMGTEVSFSSYFCPQYPAEVKKYFTNASHLDRIIKRECIRTGGRYVYSSDIL